ncbi:tRNA uridine 5-carboxymethylaminomethyl modification enzyme MnmG [Anaerocolumna cellulosilytica]|uniref:tRNA uridine 5-carboxymethylaminomethyl modification enzyme MnmG n=1 Tax=Anaerocolumna cellulosilytica TaxID=433286 RepID=A0A6S6R0H2_9FIRM|nr:tRNA uridine-5-carboxymethylaminomethyl(34) synthesis enzyme MnmG [Anaerocolumna cellulosilytica]MBB5195942.1 tRNA uridine 5-carboxymethylaminomethyl modification enzyme [Anaerocolumna cellulosilytica]BCJ96953.1 tRNA uridine 5-carboxymethylaminomethyl modification enzyme MnmG [Anaerocolumna cellulosilytica]
MSYTYETYDIVVVGAGHAGCEAALACARLGLNTLVITISMDSIALMPCNPNIGGTSKGHLVKEIDALGGEMGINIDKTYLQSKMLNISKGPAVHSLRAQADKQEYSRTMRHILENTPGLTLKQGEVVDILTEKGKVVGIKTYSDAIYPCKAVVLCTGTYLNARCIYGEVSNYTGPNGLQAATHLTDSLKALGIQMYRFKTGTPARIDKRSIDFSKMEEQPGDEEVVPFSFTNTMEDIKKEQISCWLTYTNEETHEIIRNNIHRSPLYSGNIQGTGPRYCPSIEDKVVKFADKDRHQVFIEPEGNYTNEMYVGGMSSSLPEDVQYQMYRSVAGLENAKIVRNAYAIEYDCINPMQLEPSLEFKAVEGLFSGGQFNGSSGYEEAAAQGLIAGINASMKLMGREPLILDRAQAYIGVLIDDLVTKETHEPYRMMTSRAEYRLLLRQDNADLRLTKIGYEIGLISEERYQSLLNKEKEIQEEMDRVNKALIGATKEVQELMERNNSNLLKTGTTIGELIRRPELTYEVLESIDKSRKPLSKDVIEQVNINIKYDGYIQRQMRQVEQFKKLEGKIIPKDLDYNNVLSLRKEAKQKLMDIKPISVGQASRISGVSPADISVLLVYLEQLKRVNKNW